MSEVRGVTNNVEHTAKAFKEQCGIYIVYPTSTSEVQIHYKMTQEPAQTFLKNIFVRIL